MKVMNSRMIVAECQVVLALTILGLDEILETALEGILDAAAGNKAGDNESPRHSSDFRNDGLNDVVEAKDLIHEEVAWDL